MFKHLTRLAAVNQSAAARVATTSTSINVASNAIHTSFKQSTGVIRNGIMNQQRNMPQLRLLNFQRQLSAACFSTSVTTQKRDVGALVPDYTIDENAMFDTKKIALTTEEVNQKHPIEYSVKHSREHLDYLKFVDTNEFLLFNLPRSITKEKVAELCQVKGVHVLKTQVQVSLDEKKPAFAWVRVGSPQEIKPLKEKFRNLWLEDKKVKLKAREDLGYEVFEHRTIVVRNLPFSFQKRHLVEMFSQFGALVNIELPVKNLAIEQELKNKLDFFEKTRQEKRLTDVRRAQKLVQDSIQENAEYYADVIRQHLGEEEANNFLRRLQTQEENQSAGKKPNSYLDEKRHLGIQSMIVQLQSESAQVTKAKSTLLKLRGYAAEESSSPALDTVSKEDLNKQILDNKEILKNTISYLRQNREAIDEATLAKLNSTLALQNTGSAQDPIERLISLSRKELSLAYDILLTCLSQRETVIEQRIKSQVDHLGNDERVIFEQKDWSRELEDIQSFSDPFGATFKAEEILSVSEQVKNVQEFKNLDPRERLYRMLTKSFNPFLTPNFNENQLANATSDLMDLTKIPKVSPDPNQPPSVNRANFAGYMFLEDSLEALQSKIANLRENFDMPFDELYHKEKRLVDQVIKATEALKAKEQTLPDPMGAERIFKPEELQNQYINEEFKDEHQFLKDQRRRNDKLLNQAIDGDGSSNFAYRVEESQNKIQELLANGMITQREYEMLQTLEREANEVNLGYSFVTFSHSDEAKLALILAQGMIVGEGVELNLTIKSKEIDHGDFDKRYMVNRMRNQGQIVKELQTLRESRQELREFEQNMDKDLPSLKKIKGFRDLAREVIDDPSKPKLSSKTIQKRTSQEEAELDDKIRKLQRENPDMDLTQLFETERAEAARKAQHKKAFASYKAFQFLKHGVELQSRGSTPAPKVQEVAQPAPFKSADPYDFAPLTEIVDKLTKTKERFPRILDAGEPLTNRPGRKFSYSEKDFIEAYFGKDNARNARIEIDEEASVFGFNDSYKKKYPIDKYQKLPKIEAERRFIEERSDIYGSMATDSKDGKFLEFLESFDMKTLDESIRDAPHPTEQGRTYVNDSQERIAKYMQAKEKKTGMEGVFTTSEVAGIETALREEYFPKPKKVVKEDDDSKQDEKFEPFYQGEGKDEVPAASSESIEADPATESTTTSQTEKPLKAGGKKFQAKGSKTTQKPIPEWQKTPVFDGFTAPQEVSGSQALSIEDRDANRDFVYDYRFRQENHTESDFDSVNVQRLKRLAEANNWSEEQLFEQLRDHVDIDGTQTGYAGRYSAKEKFGLGKSESDVSTSGRRRNKARSIQEFAGKASKEDAAADLSEREEEDIYNHYINEMRRAKLEQAQEKIQDADLPKHERLAQEKIKELEDLYPEMPRFEGFFKSQAEGKHPFEEDEFQRTPQDHLNEQDRKAELEYDEKLYERELEGRLIGETLTPRQFEVLYKARLTDNGSSLKYMKDQTKTEFVSQRDIIKILDEQKESTRRRMVLEGKWSEEESQEKIQAALREAGSKMVDPETQAKQKQDLLEVYHYFKNLHNPHKLLEKEYYFDEGLGESLKDHVEDIKQRFPDVQVLVRRDRDGYPIVKTQFKPKYKYNLDEIVNFDADQQMTAIKESLDDVLKTIIGGDNLNQLDKKQMESKVLMMIQNKDKNGSEKRYDLDQTTKDAISMLWKERTQGKFKNDREGFTKAFLALSENAQQDQTKELPSSPLFTEDVNVDEIYRQMNEERELITYELAEQISFRVKEHIFMKERKQTDFVRPRRSELSIFANQVQSQENAARTLEEKMAQIVKQKKDKEEGFDKEAYQALKAEIKQRREAKERLLQQGFPELKPYISI